METRIARELLKSILSFSLIGGIITMAVIYFPTLTNSAFSQAIPPEFLLLEFLLYFSFYMFLLFLSACFVIMAVILFKKYKNMSSKTKVGIENNE